MDFSQLRLDTPRMKLVPISEEHTGAVCEHFTAEITRYMWPSAPKTRQEIADHVLLKQLAMRKGEEIALILIRKDNREFLGYASLHEVQSRSRELGIWLKKSAQGHYYGYEALSALIEWAEATLHYDYLKYPVDKSNYPSRKLIEKLGGTPQDEYVKCSESGRVLHELEYRISHAPLESGL
ncbi:GNAT family N-acetyltransferase [Legionella taurinensis]|uniref:GNAT family N-acetyltransferase n=1 Tax=Legionella taurinensis TaxID=70611 RepID=A0A3A5L5H6_9GAMM|nr:GNAT family N-acetyltransferase [Legionella taurinensis]RJT48060.1 GNAT family N-acetyltransferase [Legionella taurinensis]RJT68274.1 GNAT family N-acetyltransferase [Legionella taurinensis]STY25539.1 aminoglycoside phosphotransferase [Legionella taurinensis]